MLRGRNKRFLLPWEKKFFHMQNIFIVPAMQHGCRAKPLLVQENHATVKLDSNVASRGMNLQIYKS